MKTIKFAFLIFLSISCSSPKKKESVVKKAQTQGKQAKQEQPVDSIKQVKSDSLVLSSVDTLSIQYEVSNFEDPSFNDFTINTKKRIIDLAKDSVFLKIHTSISKKIDSAIVSHFDSRNQQILSYTSGSLFSQNSEDFAFTVFDTENSQIALVVFNENLNEYYEVYRNLKVINDLKKTECGRYLRQTLDNIVASEIAYQGVQLTNQPLTYTRDPKIKIANLNDDSDLLPEYGCISDERLIGQEFNSLCFATSTAYNNWQCLLFDPADKLLRLYYRQAFAD
ncbi:hypothetical protein [Roseivirga pacifica]|uniref:hypothetical protein n=1 Tax=Roseivirga pacifica TaxID=1267423 RepID=UPI00227C2A15|nr:hypothetical protein [Roseivirga pacifica]